MKEKEQPMDGCKVRGDVVKKVGEGIAFYKGGKNNVSVVEV